MRETEFCPKSQEGRDETVGEAHDTLLLILIGTNVIIW
jgi:hypothetical protein